MLDQPYMTDLIEANSMGHEPNLIDIYSASWGPTDDGRTVDGPRNATMRAIVRGVNEVINHIIGHTHHSVLNMMIQQKYQIINSDIFIHYTLGPSWIRKYLCMGQR